MDKYLVGVDTGMDAIARWSPSSEFPAFTGDRAAVDELGRKSLRTLYMTGMFSDLPVEGQLHPGMQDRILKTMPEMDEATSGMSQFLATQFHEDLARVQLALRSPANPGIQIVEAIDENAALCGVSKPRRMQTRVLMTDAAWRLRNQPPSLAITEILDKVERVTADDVSREMKEDWLAAQVGERLFWQQQAGAGAARQSAGSGGDDDDSLKNSRLSRGAYLMGIGILVGGIAVAVAAAGVFELVFVATAGALLLLIGIVTLLVGLGTSPDAKKGD